MNWLTERGSAANPWIVCLGVFLVGATLLSGSLVVVAAAKAINYSGHGDTGVLTLLSWGFPMTVLSAGGLATLVMALAVEQRMKSIGWVD